MTPLTPAHRGTPPRWLRRLDRQLARRLQARAAWLRFVHELVCFGLKQAAACLFGAAMLALLLLSRCYWPLDAPLARYDLLTLAALALQAVLLLSGLETRAEARVIFCFHLVGTAMELFKTAVGSWSYPEPALLRLGGVPLFTGFMYAAVGSYLARVWRLFGFRFSRHPSPRVVLGLAAACYVNFFSHHYLPDARPLLYAAIAWWFAPCWIYFRVRRRYRRMPMLLGLLLVAMFIWFAENLGTYAHAWLYPAQQQGWRPVSADKLGAWLLLMMVSYAMVFALHGSARQRELERRDLAAS